MTAALSLAGCASAGRDLHPPATTVTIGALIPLSGGAGPVGQSQAETLRAAVVEINARGGIEGHPIDLRLVDTGGLPATAAEAARNLATSPEVMAVVGPSTTAETLSVIPVVQTAGLPLVSLADGGEIVRPVRAWVFKDTPSDAHAASRMYECMKQRGVKRVAVLSADNPFGRGGDVQLREQATAFGIRVVKTASFDAGAPDAEQIRAFLRDLDASAAQALVVWSTPPGPALIARLAREEAVAQPLVLSHAAATRAFIEDAAEVPNDSLLLASPLLVSDRLPWNHPLRAVEAQYERWYETHFHEPPPLCAGHAWDALNLLRDALRNTMAVNRGEPSRAKVRAWLEETRNFIGTAGRFSFSPSEHNGPGRDAFVVLRAVDGVWILDP